MIEWILTFLVLLAMALLACVIVLAWILAKTMAMSHERSERRNDKLTEHLCAFNEDQRIFMLDKMKIENSPAEITPDPNQRQPRAYQPPNPSDAYFVPGGPNDPLASLSG